VGVKGESLIIRFHNGSMYEYPNQASQYENMLKSNSKGKWVWRNLRRKNVLYRKIGVLPLPDDIGVTDEEIFQEIDNRYMADLTRHVAVPVFQSFEFIKGINYQKIQVGNINVYKAITEPLQVGARVLPKADIEFKPAKDIQEANEYAKKFADDVNITKLKVKDANAINKTLETMDQKFPLGKKLKYIKTEKIGTANARANSVAIEFNPRIAEKKKDNIKLYDKEKIQNNIDTVKQQLLDVENNPDINVNQKQLYTKKAKVYISNLEKKQKYTRWSLSNGQDTVEKSIEVTTIHEYGHIIDFNFINKRPNNVFDQKISTLTDYQDRNKYVPKQVELEKRFNNLRKQSIKDGSITQVSEYATANREELFAETFAMYNTSERDNLPDGFAEFFDDLQVFVDEVSKI
jgi:hypothetical protein